MSRLYICKALINRSSNSIVCRNSNNYDNNIVKDNSWKNDPELVKEEEAFLAKPKLSRTPP